MTTIAPLHPELRATLATPHLRDSLRSMVRRRVPQQDAEDVLQAVLCDALAAQKVPADADEIPRWLMAIARHKVADFHRRAGRERAVGGLEVRSPFDPIEERDLLARVAASESKGSAGETLRWAVREWCGVPLSEIALEAALPAEVVRQRVSRLRRKLRTKWLAAFVALIAVGSVGRELREPVQREVDAVLAPSATDTRGATTASPAGVAPLDLRGTWHVVDVTDTSRLSPALRAFVAARAPLTSLELESRSASDSLGDRVVLHTPAGDRVAFVRWTEKGEAWRGELTFGSSKGKIEIRRDGDGILVTSDEGPLPGSARLAR